MFKFLRKYNKYILAVGGTLLLITFLIPFAFTNLLPRMGQGRGTWATVGLDKRQKISYGDLQLVQIEMRVLDSAAAQLQLPIPIDRAEYWFLLSREAEQAGLVPATATILPTDQGAQQLALLASVINLPPAWSLDYRVHFIRQTLAKVQGVPQLQRLYLDSDKYSDRRLKRLARRLYHRVNLQPLVIEASAEGDGQHSRQALRKQLEKYADVVPGAGEMGFGYRLPPRARIEWLVIPTDTVRAMIDAGDKLNPVALRVHWRRNIASFPDPQPDTEIPPEVRDDLLEKLTKETLTSLGRSATEPLQSARRLDKDGDYLKIPDGWQGLAFQQLALDLQAEYGIALPEYHAIGNRWLTADELTELEGIGAAITNKFGNEPVGLSALVMGARSLGRSAMPIQIGIAGPLLHGRDGSIFIFRITDTDADRAPASVDEVMQQLVTDLNRLENYRKLADTAQSIRQVAANDGLLALAMLYDTAVDRTTSMTLGFSASLPVIGGAPEAAEAIIDHAMALPRDVPLSDLPEEDRVLVFPLADQLSLLVVRLLDQSPLTEEDFRTYMQYGLVQSRLLNEEISDLDPDESAFGYKALAERHGFELTAGDVATTQPAATDEAGF